MQRDSTAVAEKTPVAAEAPLTEADSTPGMRARAGQEARRVRHGLRRPANWFQLIRFSIVGATGYVINLAVYSTLVAAVGVHYVPAAMLAFCVAVTNNFLWNRRWTFRAMDGRATFQAPRFLTVSLVALGFNLLVLELLVGVIGVHEIPGQAAAVLAATPLNFIGNKLWSFRQTRRSTKEVPTDGAPVAGCRRGYGSSQGAGTITGSIERARPLSDSTTQPITHGSSSAVSNLIGSWVRKRSRASSFLTPITPFRAPVIPTSLM
jgi:putative flippase GtrA